MHGDGIVVALQFIVMALLFIMMALLFIKSFTINCHSGEKPDGLNNNGFQFVRLSLNVCTLVCGLAMNIFAANLDG